MNSFWEQVEFLEADIAIVGGGIIGVSTAIEIAERNPNARVVVLERGLTPSGASSRNAGFACFGSAGELCTVVSTIGREAVVALVQQRVEGLNLLRSRCGDEHIAYEASGGHELFLGSHPALDHLDELNGMIEHVLGPETYKRCDEKIGEFGLGSSVHAVVSIKNEGMLHSGKLMVRLWEVAASLGVHIYTGAEVTSIDAGRINVRSAIGDRTFRAARVVVATSAHIPTLFPDLPIKPGRGQIILTTPIPGLKINGTFHYEDGYYYFRNIGNRILIGGGRNADFDGETTLSMDTTQPFTDRLQQQLRDVVVPGIKFGIEMAWAGTMGFSDTGLPIVQFVHPNIVVAFGCNGMGVALGSTIAQQAADLVLNP